MEFDYLSRDTADSIMDDEDEGFGKFSSVPIMLNGDVEAQRERKKQHVYENFVSDVFDDLGEVFKVEDVREAIRPPYNSDEVSNALEYGVEQGDIVQEDENYRLLD